MASLTRILQLKETKNEIITGDKQYSPLKMGIKISNLSFSYVDSFPVLNDIKLNIVEALGIIKNSLNKNEIKSLYEKIFSCSEFLEEDFSILERYKSLPTLAKLLDQLSVDLYSYVSGKEPINSQEELEKIKARVNDISQKFDRFIFEDFNSVSNDSKSSIPDSTM